MSAQNSAEDGYTVVLVGDQKSGKESLMARLCNPAADPEEYPSSGVGLQSLTFDVRDQDVKLNFSNVVAEYSRTLCQICLNGAHVVLLCFCTYVPETVQALKEDWLPKVRESAPDALAILVAFCATSHLDKEYVAEKLEVSTQHISNIENASKKPSLTLLVDLAELLGVTLDDLLADTYPKERTGDVLYMETAMLLERCNAKERRIAMDMLESLVESLIRNRNRGKEKEDETIE